ncbi:hypothetical protein BO94DRAFT_623599 [Aspergillus sclerotioniger CBS 115572]|uniref:DUF6536 domain-containing protein n=1 Tax=Aspergillus sclerotioniger CBS 115572 TaxID=1450535 RepID=A0A317WT80_9EURO|nr:hypothetical protein BO94DRAFT_623599 [Aspergillus sclerotioniger CBS 115572]PWY89613.1 hypothetical protein BO94DRAFT_623599 [Aspergillus sclerotioniger CBS 115572]
MREDNVTTHERLPSTWRDQVRYSAIPNGKNQHKRSRWKTILLPHWLSDEPEKGKEWIKGAVICTWITGLILAINAILAIVAMVLAYRRKANRGQFQKAELYIGQCTRSSHWATGLHVVINVLSTILLGASSYVMQCLGAPSRTDIDRAHAKSQWLDVGTFSIRNLAVMDGRRKILWFVLFLSSTPIHMIYNSVIFSSLSTIDYGMLIIPNDLSPAESLVGNDTTGRDYFWAEMGSDAAVVKEEIFNGTFTNVTTKDCASQYNVGFNTHLGTLIFVADRQYFHNTSSLHPGVMTSSVYNYIQNLDNASISEQILAGDWALLSEYWSYRVWNYSVADLASNIALNIPPEYMPYVARDLRAIGDPFYFDLRDDTLYDFIHSSLESYIYGSSLYSDLLTLVEYNYAYNPTQEALRECLDTPSNWRNSSWAAMITFELIGIDDLTSIGNWFDNDHYWVDHTTAQHIPVSHCLVKEEEQRCQLFFSPPIAIVVIICNILKVICMALTARVERTDLMLTVGDALASFLTRPDPATLGRCLLSHADMTHGPQAWNLPAISFGRPKGYTLSAPEYPLDPIMPTTSELYPSLLPCRQRWYQAASRKRWAVVLSIFLACLITAIYLFTYAVRQSASFSTAMSLGFAQTRADTMIKHLSANMIALVLLTNTPQLVLSITYFLTNGLLTCMLVAAELDRYTHQRRPLRVSWPRDQQRSTYYLSLPYRYSVPLLTLSTTLHWLLSQSLFFVNIQAYNVFHEVDHDKSSRSCGYSPMAMFITLWVIILALGLLLGLGARQFRAHMPLATHCSAAISAACHPPPEDKDAAGRPVKWGEVQERVTEHEHTHAHCSFTSLDVVTPSLVRLYC